MKIDTKHIKTSVVVFLIIATLAVYWQVLGHQFIEYDDQGYIYDNPYVLRGLTVQGVQWAFCNVITGNWHPLTWLSHMLDAELFGMQPGGHHLISVALHTTNAILLFLMLNRFTGALWRSAVVAALFALHPLHVESVAWASERKDVLSALFWMLTLYFYAGYVKRPETKTYILIIICFILGLMAKPMLVSLPLVMLLLDYWPLGRFEESGSRPLVSINASLLKEKYPFFAIATIFSIIAFLAQNKGEAVISLDEIPFLNRLANAFVACHSYLGKTLIPLDLSVFYPFPSHISLWKSLGACIIIIIVTVALFRVRQRQPWLITGWLWYLVTLLPVIGIVQVGMQGMADRYTYIPLIGIFILGVWGVAEISGSMAHRRLLLAGLTSAIILICCFVSVRQVSYWKNTSTLFTHALVSNPDNYMAHTVLGRESRRDGNPDKAIHHFNEAIRIAPWYQISYINMGDILISLQNYDQAIIFLEKVLELNWQLYEDPYEAHYLLGLALSKTGRITEAASHFEASMRLNRNPGTSAAYCNQAFMLSKLGRLDEAIVYYGKALDINPANVECRNNLGIALAQKGRPDEAVRHFEEVLRIKPDFDVVRSNTGL